MVMNTVFKTQLKNWGVYFIVVFCAVYIHEIGHCIPAWYNGYGAVPTPAKEYPLDNIPPQIQLWVSLGGIAATIIVSLITIIIFLLSSSPQKYLPVLAGGIANPGLYTVLFLFKGRGHDATEFQEAQVALGYSYNGHFIDWLLMIIFISGIVVWLFKCKPSYKIAGKLFLGIILTFIFLVALQKINNAIFDPLF